MYFLNTNISKLNRKIFFFLFLLGLLGSLIIFSTYIGSRDFHFPLGDTLVFDYPLRFFISSAISHGIFPLWDQWRKNGTSLSATIISYNFSPIILLFSLFGVYTLKKLIIEMLFFQVVCFVGMFLWLRKYSNKWISLYGAFCFSIASPIISTTDNFGTLITMNLIPLTAYGVQKVLHGSFRYIGVISLLLLIDFTSGYLGTNIMFLPLIFLYCFLEFYFYDLKAQIRINKTKLAIAYKGIFILIILFFGLTSFQWLEAWNFTQFKYTFLRSTSFDPFEGATSFKSLITLFFTHSFPSYIQSSKIMSAPGITSMIYVGLLNLVLIIYGFINRKSIQNISLFFIFIVLTFFLSLYKYHPLKHILESIPLLTMTRWHGWYSALIIFFSITLASQSMHYFFSHVNRQEMKKLLFSHLAVFIGMVLAGIFILVKSTYYSNFFFYFVYQLTWFLFLMGILGFAFLFVKKKEYLLIFFFLLLSVGLGEYVFNAMQYLTPRDIWLSKNKSKQTVYQFEKLANSTFRPTTNERKFASVEPLIVQIPSYEGYTQFDDPTMQRLKRSVGQRTYIALTRNIFYFPDSMGMPEKEKNKNIIIKKFYPNEIDLTVISNKDTNPLIWSSPYTPFWKFSINGREIQTSKSNYGLTVFSVKKGISNIVLIYHPYYFEYCMGVLILSYFVVVWLIVMNKSPKFLY